MTAAAHQAADGHNVTDSHHVKHESTGLKNHKLAMWAFLQLRVSVLSVPHHQLSLECSTPDQRLRWRPKRSSDRSDGCRHLERRRFMPRELNDGKGEVLHLMTNLFDEKGPVKAVVPVHPTSCSHGTYRITTPRLTASRFT